VKKLTIAVLSCAALVLCAAAVYAGIHIRNYLEGSGPAALGLYAGAPYASATPAAEDSPSPSPMPEIAKIRADTTIVYEYHHEDGQTDTSQEAAPYFLIGMTEEEMTSQFTDWKVVEFSADKVVMRREIPGKSGQYYIVGVKDGYVAVFYQTPINGTNLKEITDTPVSTLPASDRQRLEDGIEITGDAALARIMQDYGS